MAQNDFAIPNQGGQAFRLDVQDALQSLAGHSSGATDPNTAVGTTYPYQFWADTSNSVMKMRNGADSAWIELFQLDGEWSTIAFENGTAAAPSIYFKDSGTDTGFYSPGANQVGISTGGTSALVVDASQRVGLGTGSPEGLFHVTTGGQYENLLFTSNAANTTLLRFGGASDQEGPYLFQSAATSEFRIANDLSSGVITFGTGSSSDERMRITQTGNVGIGSVSPTFGVGSGLEIERAGSATLRIEDSASSSGFEIQNASSSITFNGYNNQPFIFKHNASERASIDSSGRLLVGTSSARAVGQNSATAPLQIETASNVAALQIVANPNSGASPTLFFGKSRGESLGSNTIVQDGDTLGAIAFCGADGNDLDSYAADIKAQVDGTPDSNDMPGRLVFSTTADGASIPTERMRISSDGYIYLNGNVSTNVVAVRAGSAGQLMLVADNGGLFHQAGANYYLVTTAGGSTSDATLKKDVQPITNSLNKLSQIRGVTFTFIEEPLCDSDKGRQIGVIAQEVESVFPEAVVTGDDGIKAVRYDKLVAPLIEALKESKDRIETLEAKVAALEAQ